VTSHARRYWLLFACSFCRGLGQGIGWLLVLIAVIAFFAGKP